MDPLVTCNQEGLNLLHLLHLLNLLRGPNCGPLGTCNEEGLNLLHLLNLLNLLRGPNCGPPNLAAWRSGSLAACQFGNLAIWQSSSLFSYIGRMQTLSLKRRVSLLYREEADSFSIEWSNQEVWQSGCLAEKQSDSLPVGQSGNLAV